MLPALFLANASAANFVFIQQNVYTLQTLRFVSSVPQANEEISPPPKIVRLYFSTPVNPINAHVNVTDPYGNRISSSLVISGQSMTVNIEVPASGYSGVYNVEWAASCLCADTSLKTGSFSFSISQ